MGPKKQPVTAKPVSLSPLKFHQALKGLLATNPADIPPIPKHKKKPASAKTRAPAKKARKK